MEAFIVVVLLGENNSNALKSMVEAGIEMTQMEGTWVETFVDPRIALAVRKRSHASDVYFGQVEETLFFIQGWVEPLENFLSPDSLYQFAADKVIPKDLLTKVGLATQLTGSFHIVSYNLNTNQLSVFVDRLASRPVFYYRGRDHLILSSDIRAILGVPGVDCSVDIESLTQFVRIQTILGDRTLYQYIRTLMPGTVLRTRPQDSKVEIERYWVMEPLAPYGDEGEAIRGVATSFQQAGERITRGSQRSGILLSGGIDSRMTLAVIQPHTESIEAYTFGPALTDEGAVARSVARSMGIGWHFVTQTAADHWMHLNSLLPVLQACYSIAHAHTLKTVELMAQRDIDTVYDGWGIDVALSGSYLPKKHVTIVGRRLYTYGLAPLSTTLEARRALLHSLDIQQGQFVRSFLSSSLRDVWSSATVEAIDQGVDEVSQRWADPYDQFEKFLSAGFSKFRSFPVTAISRPFLRQRNLLFDSAVIDAYLRLSVLERFLGPIYSKSILEVNQELARITYSNTGVSPLAPPVVQAFVLQARQFGRANRDRVRRLLGGVGLGGLLKKKFYGSYPFPGELVQVLALGNLPTTSATKKALTDGFLAQNGIIDTNRLRKRLDECDFTDNNEALTILALASLAAWFDKYPARVSI